MRWDGLLDVERIGVSDTAACGDVSEVALAATSCELLSRLAIEPERPPLIGSKPLLCSVEGEAVTLSKDRGDGNV
jgi:hypothetical protein